MKVITNQPYFISRNLSGFYCFILQSSFNVTEKEAAEQDTIGSFSPNLAQLLLQMLFPGKQIPYAQRRI